VPFGTFVVPRAIEMPWEVRQQSQDDRAQRWLFETEDLARASFDRSRAPAAVLLAECGKVELQKGSSSQQPALWGAPVYRSPESSLDRPFWSLGLYVGGGVQFEDFLLSEAEAREAYRKASQSKVLFSPEGIPLQCQSATSDMAGLGVASAILFRQGTHLDMPIAELIAAGKAPFVPPDRSIFRQRAMSVLVGTFFSRSTVSYCACISHPNRSLSHFDVKEFPGVKGYVALTIDDAPCMLGPENSMLPEVRALMHAHQVSATFMLMGGVVRGHEHELIGLLHDGHEFGNHGMVDRPYDGDSAEAFAAAVDGCSAQIASLQRAAGVVEEGTRWFRAPHGKFSPVMEQIIGERGLTNVMCDTFASCPVIQDGEFIGRSLAKSAQDGSIILIHMPSKGAREWCDTGLRHLLEGLRTRGLRAVSLRELAQRAEEDGAVRSLRLQWMWDKWDKWDKVDADLGDMSPSRHLSGMSEADFFGVKWSQLQAPEEFVGELLALRSKFPLKVRAAGEVRSMRFSDAREAAFWVRRHFIEEHPLVVGSDECAPSPAASGDGAAESCAFFVGASGSRGGSGADLISPQRGDEVLEVNGLRADRDQMQTAMLKGPSACIKVRRKHAYFRNLLASVSYGRGMPEVQFVASPMPSGAALETLEARLRNGVEAATTKALDIVAAAAELLGTPGSPGSDWRAAVQDATDESVAAAFWGNLCGFSKLGVTKAPLFTSLNEAAAFLQAFRQWCRLQAERTLAEGSLERGCCDALAEHSVEVHSLGLGFWLDAIPLVDLDLSSGVRHGAVRRLVGSAGVCLSLGAWTSARHWSTGDLEFHLGREFDAIFFSQLGREVVWAVSSCSSRRIDALLESLRA